VRALLETSVPIWNYNWTWLAPHGEARQLRFVVSHDRSIDVILNNQRGEGFVKQVFLATLAGCSGSMTVLDIGSNTGYYSMLAAAHGCSVLAIDAQPGCAQWFEWARNANHANHSRVGSQQFSARSVRIVTRPVSNSRAPVEVDQFSCWVMHKTDIRLRRRRRRAAAAAAAAAAEAAEAAAAAPPAAGEAGESGEAGEAVGNGKVAAHPLGFTELGALLSSGAPSAIVSSSDTSGSSGTSSSSSGTNGGARADRSEGAHLGIPPVLLAKVDVEGAELGVLAAIYPLLPRVRNLLVEIAPGWWPLYSNSSAKRIVGVLDQSHSRARTTTTTTTTTGGGGGGGRSGGGGGGRSGGADTLVRVVGQLNRVHELPLAEATRIRSEGAGAIAQLLAPVAEGGAGFSAALTSNGRAFFGAEPLRDFLIHMGSNGYWHQVDVWFSRDAPALRRARRLVCLRQQKYRNEKAARRMCDVA
jgi:hypothetical protein